MEKSEAAEEGGIELVESRLYNHRMAQEIAGAIGDRKFPTPAHFLDRLFKEMVKQGVKEKWIDHSIKVGELADYVAKHFWEELGLSPLGHYDIRLAGKFHDIGKIMGFVGKSGDYRSLNGDMQMTDDELEQIDVHPLVGCCYIKMLDPKGERGINKRSIITYVMQHHENFEGSGYPCKRKGDDIVRGSRVLRVADTVDAGCDESRTWARTFAVPEMIAELEQNAGIKYDPVVAKIFYETLGHRFIDIYLKSHPGKKYFRT
jgi:HD-GYP domain-containing protein (c-di-GMP phosphodiesterase class II)